MCAGGLGAKGCRRRKDYVTLRLRCVMGWMRQVLRKALSNMERELNRLELLAETDDSVLCRLVEVVDHYNLVRHAYENGGAADTSVEFIPYSD